MLCKLFETFAAWFGRQEGQEIQIISSIISRQSSARMPKNVEMQKLCKSKAMKASFQWLSAARFIQNLASQERASPKKRCPPEGDDGGQRQVVMNVSFLLSYFTIIFLPWWM